MLWTYLAGIISQIMRTLHCLAKQEVIDRIYRLDPKIRCVWPNLHPLMMTEHPLHEVRGAKFTPLIMTEHP